MLRRSSRGRQVTAGAPSPDTFIRSASQAGVHCLTPLIEFNSLLTLAGKQQLLLEIIFTSTVERYLKDLIRKTMIPKLQDLVRSWNNL